MIVSSERATSAMSSSRVKKSNIFLSKLQDVFANLYNKYWPGKEINLAISPSSVQAETARDLRLQVFHVQ